MYNRRGCRTAPLATEPERSKAEMKENANDFIDELIEACGRHYLTLTPEQKKEADIRRACRIIETIGSAPAVPTEVWEKYWAWLAENIEKPHVRVAMERLFDACCETT